MTSNKLDICHINIRSLNDDKVEALAADICPFNDIICLTETNLPHANVTETSLAGFQNLITKNRVGKSGGGVAVYVADHVGATRIPELELPDLELLWIKLKAGSNILLLGICYRPSNSKADFWTLFQDSIDRAKQLGYSNILIAGDINAHPSINGSLMR